jgi:hypothetical protein
LNLYASRLTPQPIKLLLSGTYLDDLEITSGASVMNLAIWLPGLFLFGVVSIFACLAFAEGCGRI